VRNIELCLRFLGERGAAIDGIEPKSTYTPHTQRCAVNHFRWSRSHRPLYQHFSRSWIFSCLLLIYSFQFTSAFSHCAV